MTGFYRVRNISFDGGKVGRTWSEYFYTDYHLAYTKLYEIINAHNKREIDRTDLVKKTNYRLFEKSNEEMVEFPNALEIYTATQYQNLIIMEKIEFDDGYRISF